MEKNSAAKIISQTFQNPFNKDSFVYFIKNLLNHIEPASFIYRGNFIPDAYKPYIKTLERIGKYQDKDDKKIDLLIVHLKKETSLERARTMQRNFIAWYLNGSRGDILKDAALVAFVSSNPNDWRFSLVKMDYRLDTSGEKVKVKQELTPARRFSFLVGKTESSHTAQSCLVPILQDDVSNPTLKDLENAFSIEKVTKEFFKKYRELFLKIKEALDEIIEKDKKIQQDFKEKGVNTIDFCKKFLGQIVFLYFLQKKGWFGVKRNEKWGSGSKRFLRELFDKKHGVYKNFFNDILEPLFYEALRLERPKDYYSQFDCRIPFLNGGLFDPLNDYDWQDTDILISNKLFSNDTKTKEGDIGTGILDIFDRYNFTVKEDEPLEKEVAVDPEMLGKVFENLLEVKDRKSKGTYYTPREIVHYMCQQSLINYLAIELKEEVKKQDIEILVKYGEAVVEHNAVYIEKTSRDSEYKGKYDKAKLPKSIEKNAKLIDDKLDTIRVCDPAVGSGAFPVGMMNEIIRTRNALTPYIGKDDKRAPYNFKRHAIQSCLYGVDIDPGAVEIAKLRLWLSLVVDEEERETIQPLPNLDYKIMQGNSLFEEYEGIKLIDERFFKRQESTDEIINKLQERQNKLQKEYINLHSKEQLTAIKKAELENELSQINKEIENYQTEPKNRHDTIGLFGMSDKQKKVRQLLDMQKQFFGVVTLKDKLKEKIEKLTWELISTTLKEQGKEDKLKEIIRFQKTNIKPFFLWRLHFAEVFQEKDGFDVVIANPPYVSVKEISDEDKRLFSKTFHTGHGRFNLFTLFLEKGHKLLRPHGILTYILPEGLYSNVEYRFIREYLLQNSSILFVNLFSNRVFEAAVDTSVISLINMKRKGGSISVFRDLKTFSLELKQDDLQGLPFFIFPVNLNHKSKPIIDKLLHGGFEFLENVLEIQQGIIYSGLPKEKVFSNKKIDESYKRILDGRDILKWKINWDDKQENKFLLYSDRLHRQREERLFVAKEKILIPRKATKILAAYDNKQYYTLNTAYVCLPKSDRFDLKYILGCLNSKLINYFYSSIFFGWQITIPALNMTPIPAVDKDIQKLIITLADKILAITKDRDYLESPTKQAKVREYEKQIDQLVYKLYSLTLEEIKVVENKT